jgi:hypothetical protein
LKYIPFFFQISLITLLSACGYFLGSPALHSEIMLIKCINDQNEPSISALIIKSCSCKKTQAGRILEGPWMEEEYYRCTQGNASNQANLPGAAQPEVQAQISCVANDSTFTYDPSSSKASINGVSSLNCTSKITSRESPSQCQCS